MITWSNTDQYAITVTKPAATSLNLTATTDTVGNTVNHYSLGTIDPDWPASITLTADETGIHIGGTSVDAFGNAKQMDYANPDGTLGTATTISGIPKTASLYHYHVDTRTEITYTFVANAHEGTGVYNPLTDLPVPHTFTIKVLNSWDGNKVDILNILAKNY